MSNSMLEIEEQDLLKKAWACWQSAKRDGPIPTMADYRDALLEFPELIPNLILVRSKRGDEIEYLMLGSDIVSRRGADQTNTKIDGVHSAELETRLLAWARSGWSYPHATLF